MFNEYRVIEVDKRWAVQLVPADTSVLPTMLPITWNMEHQAEDVAKTLNKWAGCESPNLSE